MPCQRSKFCVSNYEEKKPVNDSTTNVVSFVNNIMTMKLGSYLAFGPWQVCLIFYVETRLWHTLICAVLCGQGIKLVHRFVATQSHVLLSEAWLNVFCVCIVAAWHQPTAINVAISSCWMTWQWCGVNVFIRRFFALICSLSNNKKKNPLTNALFQMIRWGTVNEKFAVDLLLLAFRSHQSS